MKKRMLALLLCLVIVVSMLPVQVFAEETGEATVPGTEASTEPAVDAVDGEDLQQYTLTYASPDDGTDPEELFTQYAQTVIDNQDTAKSDIDSGNTAGKHLSGCASAMYNVLVPFFRDVANGKRASTIISMGKTVTDETGVTHVPEVSTTLDKQDWDPVDVLNVLAALLTDLPLEQYWFDKAIGVECEYYATTTRLYQITFRFVTAEHVRGKDAYTVNTSITGAPRTAVENAKKIADSLKGKTDYEKLVSFRDAICALTEFNRDAVSGSWDYHKNNNPWQLIYVFDGDTNTKVVGEGYSKAFQYLFDLSTFSVPINCITVDGTVENTPHMWNLVHIYGKSYIVDVTNVDAGSYGTDNLFMVGGQGSPKSGYNYRGVEYDYSEMCQSLWGVENESILELNDKNFDPNFKPPVTRIYGATRYETCLQIADKLKEVFGVQKFENVVIASGTNFADALSGSYLACQRKAPILLCSSGNMTALKDYIRENLKSGGTVYILGGTAAVPANMESDLDGFQVKRLAGADRYDTNLKILEEAGVKNAIFVCTGKSFADSLSVSACGQPIMLVGAILTEGQKKFLKEHLKPEDSYIDIIGGTNAVSTAMENELKPYCYGCNRTYGSDRYETSLWVAQLHAGAFTSSVVLAYGANFPDGLCGGPLAYAMDVPLILTAPGKETQAARLVWWNPIERGIVLGGPGLISDLSLKYIFL